MSVRVHATMWGLAGLAAPALAQCTASWAAPFGLPAGADIQAVTIFDFDGGGPEPARVVVAGDITTSDGQIGRRVAWFDGSHWQAFGGAYTGTVNAIAFHDFDGDGPEPEQPVVGGAITAIGGTNVSLIARWNGAAWQPLADGLSGGGTPAVHALASFDPDGPGSLPPELFAGGQFTHAGATLVNNIARWTGASWQPMGTGVTATAPAFSAGVKYFHPYDPDLGGPISPVLIVAGGFTGPGSNIASWTGSAWQSLGSLTAAATGLALHDADGPGPGLTTPHVVVSGVTDAVVRRWTGATWTNATTSVSNGVGLALASFDADGEGPGLPELVVIGNFTQPVATAARWNGAAWQALGPGLSTVSVAINAMVNWDADGSGPSEPTLVIGRVSLPSSQVGSPGLGGLGLWDGQHWSTLGSGLVSNFRVSTVTQVLRFDPDGGGPMGGELIAVGDFRSAENSVLNGVARWAGQGWQPLGQGVAGSVRRALVWDRDGEGPMPSELFVAQTVTVGGVTTSTIQRWDGSAWSLFAPSPGGTAPGIDSMVVWDEDGAGPIPEALFACGEFNTGSLARIARWDGTAWQPLNVGLNARARTLEVWDADGDGPSPSVLLVGGDFTQAGPGVFINRVAAWNGASWSGFGAGLNANVLDLLSFDPDHGGPQPPQLIAGGDFGIGSPSGVARWTGSNWAQVGNGLRQTTINGGVESLSTFDPDGTGPLAPLLIAGGRFTNSGAAAVTGIAFWNGTTWTSPSPAIASTLTFSSTVSGTLPFDVDGAGPLPEQLVVAGRFTGIGGLAAASVALWQLAGAPEFTAAPQDITTCDGDVALEVIAQGFPIPTYRWRRGGVELSDGPRPGGSLLSGTHTARLVIAGVSRADAGLYDCLVTNACDNAQSGAARLTVISADLTTTSDPLDPSYGIPDGIVDSSDFFYFLDQFVAGDLDQGDLTGSTDPNDPAYGIPDGLVDASDFFYYLDLFVVGCG